PAVLRVAHGFSQEPRQTMPTGMLHVDPEDAHVELDGQPLPGPAPFALPPPDDHEHVLTVLRPGYAPEHITVEPREPWPEMIVMKPDPGDRGPAKPLEAGFVRVVAPSVPWAEVTIDGRPVGHTPTRSLEVH